MIADFSQAGQTGERRRAEVSDELRELEERITETDERLDGLLAELEERIAEERGAKEA